MRRLIVLLALSVLSSLGAGEYSDRRAPGFSLPDADFTQHDLYDYREQVVVLNVMKTTCPHCGTLSTILDEAEKHYGGAVKVLCIVNPPDNQHTVRQYLADHEISTTILFDSGQVVASYLKLTPQNPSFRTPHFFVIDQQGRIREDYSYEPLSKNIFEGDGIYEILDRYVTPPAVAD